MSCTKMCVYSNMKRPEMINAVRALGYDGEVTLAAGASWAEKSIEIGYWYKDLYLDWSQWVVSRSIPGRVDTLRTVSLQLIG